MPPPRGSFQDVVWRHSKRRGCSSGGGGGGRDDDDAMDVEETLAKHQHSTGTEEREKSQRQLEARRQLPALAEDSTSLSHASSDVATMIAQMGTDRLAHGDIAAKNASLALSPSICVGRPGRRWR